MGTSAAAQAGTSSSAAWEFHPVIVSSVLTGAATAALGNSQGGSRGGKAGRERECDESGIKINGQKPFLCSSTLSPLPRKAGVDGSPRPPPHSAFSRSHPLGSVPSLQRRALRTE